jgi:DNA repair photolyase
MEIPALIKAAADAGAVNAGYTMVRLNGAIGDIFEDWIKKALPDRAEKVLNQIREVHGGTLNDSRFGTRMKGEGNIAFMIRQMFHQSVKKHLSGRSSYEYDYSLFKVPSENGQLDLF